MASAIEATENDFLTYRTWLEQQTCFASFDDDRESKADWLVVPFTFCPNVAQLEDESNQAALTKMLEQADPTGETYELQRFGHWATPYERFIVAPNTPAHKAAAEAICALSEHPILDESDFSERENDAAYENIQDAVRSLTFERDDKPVDSEEIACELHQWYGNNGNWGFLEDPGQRSVHDDERDEGLAALGWVCCIDDTWRPESETEPLADPDAPYDSPDMGVDTEATEGD